MKKIGILGGGVWGCALAKLLSVNNKVCIYARDEKIVASINDYKFNPKLKYSTFNDNVSSTKNINDLDELDYFLITIPSQNIREVLKNLKIRNTDHQIIIASKGIEISSNFFLSEVVDETLKSKNINVLSGPCFSHEVVQNLPTAVTLATNNKNNFDQISELFQSKNFRLYFSDDLIGCQLGGSIKNIYAIATGISNGLNLGENAKSALIARSFAEILRLGKVLNVQTNTLFGLSGLGDLILTCNSLKSRNTYFGHLIASQPQVNIEDHLKSQPTTEGYYTIKAVKNIAEKNNVNMPIMNSIYDILYNKADIKNKISELLERPIKAEFE
tara:strand:- start:241 stop:1227 length:987 start_codon:yes stop_codon:yes gene_type:complete